jgi:hypothetical protein
MLPVAGTPFAASVLGETFAVSATLLPKVEVEGAVSETAVTT